MYTSQNYCCLKVNSSVIILYMDSSKNIKSIQANLEFLKKFEGKRSIITKDGLINALDSAVYSPLQTNRQIKNKNVQALKGSNKEQSPSKGLKLINTEPSSNYQIFEYSNQFMHPHIELVHKKRMENGSKHSNRTEKPLINYLKFQNMGKNWNRQQIESPDKLPKLAISKSERNLQKHRNVVDYAMSMSHRGKKIKTSQNYYEIPLKNDISAADYFKQLQKFESSLKSIKQRASRKGNKFSK